jgi:hypothetical protein
LVEIELPGSEDSDKTGLIAMVKKLGFENKDIQDSKAPLKLSMSVTKISMPGQSVSLKRSNLFGPQRFVYTQKEYQDISISFIESADMKMKNFFKYWISRGYNDITGERKFFPDDISGIIRVYPLKPNGDAIETLDGQDFCCEIFYKAMPYEVSDYDLDNTQEDTNLNTIEVKFAYRAHLSQFDKVVKLPTKF